MKLMIVLICLVGILSSFGKSYSQNTKLSVEFKKSSIESVLIYIEGITEYSFMYDNKKIDISREVSISVKDQTVEAILDQLFDNSVSYKMVGKHIIITPKEERGSIVSQQPATVSGRVVDSSGQPLPGVTVIIKGKTIGTVTDIDGNFSLANVPSDATLVISFVGMKSQEMKVLGKTKFEITMIEESVGIDEVAVVAIGYGSTHRSSLTGSIASVSGNTLKDIPVSSAAQAIAGKMAGVQVTQTEGSPDAEIKIRIRGGGSITQDNAPLYIVDGFPVESISGISPNDIESIDVLKDASSTAIYGARGANGVVIITTKSGGAEMKGTVSYNMYFGVKNNVKNLDVLNPYEYVYYQYELMNPGSLSAFEGYFGPFNKIDEYKNIPGKNWQDEIFGRTGTTMSHNISFSGGTKSGKYSLSITRNDDKEIMIGSGREKTTLNFKTTNKINSWLSTDFGVRLSDDYLKGAGTSSMSRLTSIVQYRPISGLSDINPDLEVVGPEENFTRNPLKQTIDDYRRKSTFNINLNGALNLNISKELKYRMEYGQQYGEVANNRFYGLNTTTSVLDGAGLPITNIEKINSRSYRLANILTYTKNKIIPDGNFTAMAGQEMTCSKGNNLFTEVKYFPQYINPETALAMMQLGTPTQVTTLQNTPDKLASFFGRLNFDYKGKYLASATFRADGSSKFAPGHQWGYFPSAALAWRVMEESFMESTKGWLDNLKLRVSYGQAGNNRIPDNAWQKTFQSATGSFTIGNDGQSSTPTPFFAVNKILSNPKLKWETTITRNIGLDFGFLESRISGTAEIYKNTTRDLLINATIPASSGYNTQWQNIGQTYNKGLEITLNAVLVQKKDFRLSLGFNIAFNRNKIEKLGATKSFVQQSGWFPSSSGPGDDYIIKEGGRVGLMYGYVTDGMYTFDDFNYSNGAYILKQSVPNNQALVAAQHYWPGTLKFKDLSGGKDGDPDGIPDGVIDATYDRTVIGDANPKHTGGFNITTQFKGFDFSVFFNWMYGNDIYNANKMYFSSYSGSYNYRNILNSMNSDTRFIYSSKADGSLVSDPAALQALNEGHTMWSASFSSCKLHSWVIEDGSFLRLNNLTVANSGQIDHPVPI